MEVDFVVSLTIAGLTTSVSTLGEETYFLQIITVILGSVFR